MLITQGKTNITYLLIVIIIAAVVGGGVLYYNYYKPMPIDGTPLLPKSPVLKVIVDTDKTEYKQGETVSVVVKNNTVDTVCFESCNPYYLEKKNGEWKTDPETIKLCFITTIGECIKSTENKVFEFNTSWESYEKDVGTYRVVTNLCKNCKDLNDFIKNSQTYYSNEFTISKKETSITWREVEKGQWEAMSVSCEEVGIPPFPCRDNCYEKLNEEIWDLCKDRGEIDYTNTGIEVLCFSQGCMPYISVGECKVACPE